jgi:Protein of unknown function (DUF4058)
MMPSPFPGMNPYLEQDDAWEDFHHRFIAHMGDELGGLVGEKYQVKVETRLYLHELSAEERRYLGRADVSVSGRHDTPGSSAVATLPAPISLSMPDFDTEKYSFLEIRDRRNRRVITAVELLSPTNKSPGPDRDDYLRKRLQYMATRVNLVEIDLRRGGKRPAPPEIPPCDYYVVVARWLEAAGIGCWPIRLRDRLPAIPIPLTASDREVQLDLQPLFLRVFDAAHYGNYIYSETPDPPLSAEDAEWAKQFVQLRNADNRK